MKPNVISLIVLVVLCVSTLSAAQPAGERQTLTVGVKEAPPFVIKGSSGSWSGISIELLDEICEDLRLSPTLVETDLEGLFKGVRDGEFDMAIAAITVTSDRERDYDFSHPIYTTGLGIAVLQEKESLLGFARRLMSGGFWRVILMLLVTLLGVGILVWMVERKHNTKQFERKTVKGIGSGIWWAAVTMTTVGYGDKAPVTLAGRLLGLAWMFSAIILISTFTAAVTSSLTVSHFESGIRGPNDLSGVQVGAVRGSTSERYLSRMQIPHTTFDSVEACLSMLDQGELDAVVHDAPILEYRVRQRYASRITLAPKTFEPQDYAVLLPSGSPHREAVSQVVLDRTRASNWSAIVDRYLGR